MLRYRYNTLDIAAYFKWASLSSDKERTYLEALLRDKEILLARPETGSFESFENRVFSHMYHLWSRGFVNEFSDVRDIPRDRNCAVLADPSHFVLENYLKLLALHLILSDGLPYIRINLIALCLFLGVDAQGGILLDNLRRILAGLGLKLKDSDGETIDFASAELPKQPLFLSLDDDLIKELFGTQGYRTFSVHNHQEKMKALKDQASKDKEKHEQVRQDAIDAHKREGKLRSQNNSKDNLSDNQVKK